MFNRMSLQTKLVALSAFMSVLLSVVGYLGYSSLSHVDKIYDTVSKTNIPNLTYLVGVESDEKAINIYLTVMSVEKPGTPAYLRAEKKLDDTLRALEKSVKTYESQPFGPGEEALWNSAKESLGKFTAFVESSRALADDEARDGQKEFARRMSEQRPGIHSEFEQRFDKLQEQTNLNTREVLGEADATITLAYKTIGFSGGAGILLALIFGYLTARSLSKTLVNIATRLTNGSKEVSSATNSIAEAGTELSASATEQAAALQETVASLEEVSAMVNKNAENARRSLDTSTKSQDAAGKGKRAVQEMIGSIEEINRSNTEIMGQIEQSNREIAEIVKVIGEIGNKTKVINDIVFQTKLLSFNASVEAARAGEHGKGFAVVAEEVGNLAQMSGNAAKEISGMLEESMRKVQGIADDTKTKVQKLVLVGKEKVEAGSQTANRCATVLDEIFTNVSQVNQMVEEIATASREQAQGVQEINKAMGQLDQVTHQNSASAQQSASAAEQLRGQTADLDAVVVALQQTLHGSRGEPSPSTNVVAVTKSRKEASPKSESGTVVPLRPKTEHATASARPASLRKRAVGEVPTPSEDDPRFEDV